MKKRTDKERLDWCLYFTNACDILPKDDSKTLRQLIDSAMTDEEDRP